MVWKSSPLDANVEESSNRTKSLTEPLSRVDDAATTDDGSVKRNSPGVEEFVRRNSEVMFHRNLNGILFELEIGPFTGKCPFTISIGCGQIFNFNVNMTSTIAKRVILKYTGKISLLERCAKHVGLTIRTDHSAFCSRRRSV